ncbi:SIMPL domain-containing protein [Pontixanthobacter sp. CEM42]|uniref:SIMPL domain-containing protein n=1 Tax=Pontixanthobacter sp. CEM42 TaxID=2792077 RepID=UPI001AE06454|nr:SIMPL domain-containing protein [Pontixanthobacter sp. CEM42]
MVRFAIPLLVATAISGPLAAAEVQIQAAGPVVELSITETVKAAPDLATISAGVTSEARTAVEAMQINAREMTAVITRIKALGIDEADIQTSGINLNAQYDYNRQTQKQVFRGYAVSNRVSVTLREVKKTGEVLDALVAAGATDIGGPSFSIDDDTAAKAQARKAAMETAKIRAMEYASWSGYSGIKLLEISEAVSRSQPVIMQRGFAADAPAELAATPVQPGMVGTGVTVTVKYEMTQ